MPFFKLLYTTKNNSPMLAMNFQAFFLRNSFLCSFDCKSHSDKEIKMQRVCRFMGRKPNDGSKNGTDGHGPLPLQGHAVTSKQFRGASVDSVDKGSCKHHFFLAADLVVLPAASAFSTDLMTPTATVCFMSRTANRPRGG